MALKLSPLQVLLKNTAVTFNISIYSSPGPVGFGVKNKEQRETYIQAVLDTIMTWSPTNQKC